MGASPHAVTDLAKRLRRLSREEAQRAGTNVERWAVIQTTPLLIEEAEGELVLEDGDPDLTIGSGLRQHIARYGLTKGDQVLVVRSSAEWHAFDAAPANEPIAGALKAGSYTITGATPTRTLHVATATAEDVANVLAALIQDLGGA